MTEFGFESINWSPYFGHPEPDPDGLVDAAARAGFDWISFDSELLAHAATRPGGVRALGDTVRAAGLRPLAVHALAITADADATLTDAAPLVEAAAALGALWLQAGVTDEPGGAVDESARRTARHARASGIALAIEFLPFLPVASIAQTRAIVAACDDPGAGLVVDSWHFFHGPDDWDALEGLRPGEIAYVQLDDHPHRVSDDLLVETTQRRVLPGQGTFDLARFAATLRGVGYDGIVTLEHLSAEARARPPREVASELIAAARACWEGVAPPG